MNTYPHLTLGPVGKDGLPSTPIYGSLSSSSGPSFDVRFHLKYRKGDLVRMHTDHYQTVYEIISVNVSVSGGYYYHLRRWRWPKAMYAGAPHNKLTWIGRPDRFAVACWLSGRYNGPYQLEAA